MKLKDFKPGQQVVSPEDDNNDGDFGTVVEVKDKVVIIKWWQAGLVNHFEKAELNRIFISGSEQSKKVQKLIKLRKLKDAVIAFSDKSGELLDAWDNDHEIDYFPELSTDYPFENDFAEKLLEIHEWKHSSLREIDGEIQKLEAELAPHTN